MDDSNPAFPLGRYRSSNIFADTAAVADNHAVQPNSYDLLPPDHPANQPDYEQSDEDLDVEQFSPHIDDRDFPPSASRPTPSPPMEPSSKKRGRRSSGKSDEAKKASKKESADNYRSKRQLNDLTKWTAANLAELAMDKTEKKNLKHYHGRQQYTETVDAMEICDITFACGQGSQCDNADFVKEIKAIIDDKLVVKNKQPDPRLLDKLRTIAEDYNMLRYVPTHKFVSSLPTKSAATDEGDSEAGAVDDAESDDELMELNEEEEERLEEYDDEYVDDDRIPKDIRSSVYNSKHGLLTNAMRFRFLEFVANHDERYQKYYDMKAKYKEALAENQRLQKLVNRWTTMEDYAQSTPLNLFAAEHSDGTQNVVEGETTRKPALSDAATQTPLSAKRMIDNYQGKKKDLETIEDLGQQQIADDKRRREYEQELADKAAAADDEIKKLQAQQALAQVKKQELEAARLARIKSHEEGAAARRELVKKLRDPKNRDI